MHLPDSKIPLAPGYRTRLSFAHAGKARKYEDLALQLVASHINLFLGLCFSCGQLTDYPGSRGPFSKYLVEAASFL